MQDRWIRGLQDNLRAVVYFALHPSCVRPESGSADHGNLSCEPIEHAPRMLHSLLTALRFLVLHLPPSFCFPTCRWWLSPISLRHSTDQRSQMITGRFEDILQQGRQHQPCNCAPLKRSAHHSTSVGSAFWSSEEPRQKHEAPGAH